MPTLPSGSGRDSHLHRAMAESFGVDAARYDRSRPPYPDALIGRVVAASPGTDLLDVGCGTGIAARQFLAAGRTVLGVEPDDRMAGFARRTGVDVEVGTFEDWDDAGRRFDAVVAGQSWHWVDAVAGATKAARLLRPGGLLATFWHVFQPPAPIGAAFAEVFRRVAPDAPVGLTAAARSPALATGYYSRTADGVREAGGFGGPERWEFTWTRDYTREEWLDFVPTQGIVTRLPADALAEILAAVGAAIDAMGGRFTMEFTTVAAAAVRA